MMETILIDNIIAFGNFIGGEILSCLLLAFCFMIILLLWRFQGIQGLYLYNVIAVVVANIQVLKTTSFFLSSEPVALGTILFATTFLVSDIITEHCSAEQAKQSIILSFIAQVLMTIFMIVTLAYPYGSNNASNKPELDNSAVTQFALYILFSPSPRLLIASLTSYCVSQWLDIKIFKAFKDYTRKKLLWLRLNASTMISGFIDNILFSILAWVLLNPHPVALNTLIFTYILGTYGARIAVSITSTPIIYLTYKFQPRKK